MIELDVPDPTGVFLCHAKVVPTRDGVNSAVARTQAGAGGSCLLNFLPSPLSSFFPFFLLLSSSPSSLP